MSISLSLFTFAMKCNEKGLRHLHFSFYSNILQSTATSAVLAAFLQGTSLANGFVSSDRSSRERERFISSHDIGCIFSYKLRYFRQTCGAYMVNTDLLPAAPQIAILSSFFLVELPDSKSQLMEQIVLSIMVFCLGGSHQSLKIFCFNLKKVLKILSKRNSVLSSRPGTP